jgi:AcrR family transcriptional regulator
VADPDRRSEARVQLLDAAERLLVSTGYASISTRRLAEEAGVNHGLVHYYFGSMDELFLQAAERISDRMLERQRAMYGTDEPFLAKWRAAMDFLDDDIRSGVPKIWFEFSAMAWNDPAMAQRMVGIERKWRKTLTDAFTDAHAEYGLDADQFPVPVLVSLVMTFNLGIEAERLVGVTTGHRELLAWIDRWLAGLDRQAQDARRPAAMTSPPSRSPSKGTDR